MSSSTAAMRQLEKINKELLLVFSMFVGALLVNFLIDAQRMVLYVYTLPTVASAYLYGRRHATLTAVASVLLVTLLTITSPGTLRTAAAVAATNWLDLVAWGCSLIVTAYLMGPFTSTERTTAGLRETITACCDRGTSSPGCTEHHSHRVPIHDADAHLQAERQAD